MPSQKRYTRALVHQHIKKAKHVGDGRNVAKHILGAFDHARRWAAMNSTREVVMLMAHPHWVVAPLIVISPQQLSKGDQSVVMGWVHYASETYMQHVRSPVGGLVIPVVWRNHYTVLLIPRDRQLCGDWFDSNYMGRRVYPSLDVTELQKAVGRSIHVHTFHHRRVVCGGLQDEGIHDVFCAVWILWYMTQGVGRDPVHMRKPTFADVFRFLQRTVYTLRSDFHQYLLDHSLSDQEVRDVIVTILSVRPVDYRRAFYHSSMW